MNFYCLGPTNLLNTIAGPTYSYHMALAQHLYDDDFMPTDYFMYYNRRCRLKGYHVILDNGAYEEEPVKMETLLRATVEMNPHIVILPDVPHNMLATLAGGDAFKVLLRKHAWRGDTMTVVHGEPGNLDQYIHSYMEACKQSRAIGIPRNQKSGLSRVKFMEELVARKVFDRTKHHHALGMVAGSLPELREVVESGFFMGCDSTAPIWRGLNGYDIEDSTWPGKIPLVASDCVVSDDKRNIAYNNLDKVIAICTRTESASAS